MAHEYVEIGEVAAPPVGGNGSKWWSIGAETMDRDYTLYEEWKDHLAPLGISRARIQAGWAKTEVEPGVYEWNWLDDIVFDMNEKGITPWVCLCYGNERYDGGGGAGLGDQLPETEAALEAWDRWVRANVARYQAEVGAWEVWNEADNGDNPPSRYASFFERTAQAVREVDADATVYAFALSGHMDVDYVDEVLEILETRGTLELIDAITYHPYSFNPDVVFTEPGEMDTWVDGSVADLRATVSEYEDSIELIQGENGVPSDESTYALSGRDWTERSQAKWALRRLLGDRGHDIPSSYFQIADMLYPSGMNRKGLLRIARDKSVEYRKPAYDAVQHVTSVFDDSLDRIKRYPYALEGTDRSVSVFGYESRHSGRHAVTAWQNGAVPDDDDRPVEIELTCYAGDFEKPVYVDMLEGTVFELPADAWNVAGGTHTFSAVEVPDYPILIADTRTVPIA